MSAPLRLKYCQISRLFTRIQQFSFIKQSLSHKAILQSAVMKSYPRVSSQSVDVYQKRTKYRDQCSKFSMVRYLSVLAFVGLKKAVEPQDHGKPEDDIIMAIKHAILAERRGEFDRADKFYHQALTCISDHQKIKDMNDRELMSAKVNVYDRLANLALSQGRFGKAETLYKETMRGLLEGDASQMDNSIVEISLKLAMIYGMQDNHADAEKGYNFCISTQEEKLKYHETSDSDTIGLLGMCLNSYSRFLLTRGRAAEAEEQMKKCVTVGKQAFGDSHPQVAVLLSDLAAMQSELGKYSDAIGNIDSAIYIAENTASPDIAILYCNRGEILIKLNKSDQAKQACSEALEMAKKIGDKFIEDTAKACIDNCKS